MDKIVFLRMLEKIGGLLRASGLHRISRLGRHLLKGVLGDNLSVRYHGLQLSGPIEHRGLLYQVQTGTLEPFMSELYQTAVKSDSMVLDIGACLGYYTLLAAQKGAKVYAFEPSPETFPYLIANMKKNGFSHLVTPVSKAVSAKAGVVSFFLHDEDPSRNSMFDRTGQIKETIMVEAISIDEFLEESAAVNVVKMDIEGAELHALRGMKRTIARAKNRLTMFVECKPSGLRWTGGSANGLIERLKGFGFEVMIINEQGRYLSPVGPDIESVKQVNLYCVRDKETP